MTIEITNFTILITEEYMISLKYVIQAKKIYLFFSFAFIVLGLLGHLMTVFVFAQTRFRRNSSNVYLFTLALADGAYLIVHFFEDTLKTSRDIYFSQNELLHMLNIVERFDLACRLFNYLRYILKFISSYIIVVFTLQRLFLVYLPFSHKFKTKKSAWISVLVITLLGFLVNLWAPFLFEKNINDSFEYCDINVEWTKKQEFFHISLMYTSLIILIPIVITLVSNLLMINKLLQSKLNKRWHLATRIRYRSTLSDKCSAQNSFHLKPYYISVDQIISRVTNKANSSKKITLMLIIISASFTFLNIPYLISWSFFYKEMSVSLSEDTPSLNYLYSSLKISEIFSVLIYSINFYLYCASGSLFRNQLKYSINTKFCKKNSNYFKVKFYPDEGSAPSSKRVLTTQAQEYSSRKR